MRVDSRAGVERFRRIGVDDAAKLLNIYEQNAFFLDWETGKIGTEAFMAALRAHTGKPITLEQVGWAWQGFILEVEQYKLDFALSLRGKYRTFLLTNTNPVVFEWVLSSAFDPAGNGGGHYFEKLYPSYATGYTKPHPQIFQYVCKDAGIRAEETLFIDDGKANIAAASELGFQTYLAENGADWRSAIARRLQAC